MSGLFEHGYPYTDSHELNLSWVILKVKELAEAWAQVQQDWTDEQAAFANLQSWIENYFNNLNVQTEINVKLDAMVEAGTMSELIAPYVASGLPAEVADQIGAVVASQIGPVVAAQISAVVADQLPAVAAAAAASEVSDWLAAHVNPETGYVIDDSFTVQGAAADAKAVGDEFTAIKSALTASDVVPLSNKKSYNGFILGTGKWGNVNDNFKMAILPLSPGQKVTMKGNNATHYYWAVLSSFSGITDGADVPFSAQEGFTTRYDMNSTSSNYFIAPSDSAYLAICTVYNGNNASPSLLTIDNYVVTASVPVNHRNTLDILKYSYNAPWIVSGYINIPSVGNQCDLTPSSSNNIHYMIIPCKRGDVVTITAKSRSGARTYGILSEARYVRETCSAGEEIVGKKYIFIDNGYLVVNNDKDYTTALVVIDRYIRQDLLNDLQTQINTINTNIEGIDNLLNTGVDWCAMGDSITQGYYSYFDNQHVAHYNTNFTQTWVPLVANRNLWEVTNMGIGGTGFLFRGPNAENDHGTAYYLARHTDFTGYNLVTLAYGVNDWKANCVIGTINDDATAETPTTVIQAAKATIEAIMTSNPNCKIIGILPLNLIGYSYNYGNKAGNYALSYEFSNSGTLETFTQKLKEVYDYYGIQYIDMTHYSCVNRENLLSVLPDGVHPSLDCHALMAHELSRKITF